MRSGVALTTTRRCEGTRGQFPISRKPSPPAKFEPGIYDVVESFRAPPRGALDPISWTPSELSIRRFGRVRRIHVLRIRGTKPEISTRTASAPVRAK